MSRSELNDSAILLDHRISPATDRSRIGNKAAGLARLQALGFTVPPFLVVSSPLGNTAANSEFAENLLAACREKFAGDDVLVVRSSAIGEDGEEASFAGIYESVIGVQSDDELLAAVHSVQQSAASERARAYRQGRGVTDHLVRMPVIIQQLIETTRAGVCFTSHPVQHSHDFLLIAAVYGLGGGLVNGGLTADQFTVEKRTGVIDRKLTTKPTQLIFDRDLGRVHEHAVCAELQELSCLSDEEIGTIVEAAQCIATELQAPQDIEFGIDPAGQLMMLQARPITTLKAVGVSAAGAAVAGDGPARKTAVRDAGAEHRTIWDNSNIIESYSGVTTPMTFSFIKRAYSIVYHCFSEVMGISPAVVKENRHVLQNMLGLFRGRVYYNLKNWYQLVRLFPGFRYNSEFMESMMGLKESLYLDEDTRPMTFYRKWFVEFPGLVKLVVRTSWNFWRIDTLVDRFEHHFYTRYDEWSQYEYDERPLHEIMALYQMMEDDLLWKWQTPIINDFYVMVFYGILKKLCSNWCGDQDSSLQNGLICGEGGLLSDEPAKLIMQLAIIAHQDPELERLLREEPLPEVMRRVEGGTQFAEFRAQMQKYLQEFGLRCANELKLEASNFRDAPERVYGLVRNQLLRGVDLESEAGATEQRRADVRQSAEQQAEQALRSSRIWWPRRWLFWRVLDNARRGIRNRENMRFARTRIYGVLREMLRALGRQFHAQGIIDRQDDIFYLTLDEVWDFIKGTAVSVDLRGLASVRRNEFERYQLEPDPPNRFETFGLAYAVPANETADSRPAPSVHAQPRATSLTGIACCPGVVTGKVQVVNDPYNVTVSDETGMQQILVARRTDPGWVTVYPTFGGILVERGSVLSHSAIIARELGIPTIVGIPGLLDAVATGQRVRMDGRTGFIELIE